MPKVNIVRGLSNFSLLSISKSSVSKVKIMWGFSKFLCVGRFVIVHGSFEWLFAEVLIF